MNRASSMSSSCASGSLVVIGRAAAPPPVVSVSPNCSTWRTPSLLLRPPVVVLPLVRKARSRRRISRCEVAVEESASTQGGGGKVGARVRVKVPLKVYHVPRVPDGEVDLTGMEGQIKQYVALWNGKRISANLPYKVEFVTDIPGRGPVKFFAHLKEDEFDFL